MKEEKFNYNRPVARASRRQKNKGIFPLSLDLRGPDKKPFLPIFRAFRALKSEKYITGGKRLLTTTEEQGKKVVN